MRGATVTFDTYPEYRTGYVSYTAEIQTARPDDARTYDCRHVIARVVGWSANRWHVRVSELFIPADKWDVPMSKQSVYEAHEEFTGTKTEAKALAKRLAKARWATTMEMAEVTS